MDYQYLPGMFVCHLGEPHWLDADKPLFPGRIYASYDPHDPRPWVVDLPGCPAHYNGTFHTLQQAYRYATYELGLPPYEDHELMYIEQCTWLDDHGISYDYHMSAAAAEQLIYETLSA